MFAISPINHEFDQQIQTNIDSKTKPLGALGELETLALQIAQVLGKVRPQIHRPAMLVFAADHGWTVVDAPAYDRAEAERAYAMLLELYAGALD